MTTLTVQSRDRWPAIGRIVSLVLWFLVQVELVEVAMRQFYDPSNVAQSVWAPIAGKIYLLSFVVVFPATFLIISWQRLGGHLSALMTAAVTRRWSPWIGLQGLAYLLFVGLTYELSADPYFFGEARFVALLGWLAAMLATFAFWLLVLAPRSFWVRFLIAEYRALLMAAIAAICVTGGKLWLQSIAPWLGMLTLNAVDSVSRFFFDEVVYDQADRVLGTPAFSVILTDHCSGYEGISLIVVFLAIYLWTFRREFRFPKVLIVFPIAIVAIWVSNVFRITALIAIGNAISPEIAIAGFHSNAGWIAFILVSFGATALLHRTRAFAHPAHDTATTPSGMASVRSWGVPEALLVPFVVLLSATLVSDALSATFNWLYPFKVTATGLALWWFWDSYQLQKFIVRPAAIGIGVVVFLVWLLLVQSPSVAQDQAFAVQLFAASTPWTMLWLFFRVIGAAIVIPFAEELLFRGYLLAKLAGKAPSVEGAIPFTWFSFLVSSAAFGILHDDWLAGVFAGMAYALARYHRNRLGDAVVAHVTTNLLLCAFVLGSQQWSYW